MIEFLAIVLAYGLLLAVAVKLGMRTSIRILVACFGVLVMYLEGQARPDPGIGFAIGMALILGAALFGGKKHGNDTTELG